MKINANSIRMGNVLEHNGKLYVVIKTPEHTMPGKGGAYVQVSMKDLQTGTKVNERFRSSEDVEKARLDQKENQFLYSDEDFIYLMDNESYEQIQVDKSMLDKKIAYLQEGMNVVVEFYETTPIKIELPSTVNLEVSETEPVVKGQTAASSYKPAVMENGIRVMVPPFIDPGTKIVVRTEDDTYVERCK
ncbi:MAG: elongation factor P [Alphaproteobacteria bacterium]|nr:elongation factor P [Alphaproteobacteria bacterium]